MAELERTRQYLSLEKIRFRYDALFFNELRRFFREELLLILVMSEIGENKINELLEARKQKLEFLLAPLYSSCVSEFYVYNLSQKSLQKTFKVSQDIISYRAQKIIENTKEYVAQAFKYPNMVKEKLTALYSNNGRITRIARTEVNTASNLGLYECAKAQGKKYKIWICSRNEGVREGHRKLDGEKQLLNDSYSNNLLFPGDPKAPVSQIVNCRCFQIFV